VSLHPRLTDAATTADHRARWAESGGCLRIERALRPGLADALEPALLELPFTPHRQDDAHARCFFWRCIVDGRAPLPAPWDGLAEAVLRDLPALLGAITGRSVQGLVEPWLPVCRYRKGCYLDPHEDHGVGQATAFVLGLTRASWPAERGGWLTFLGPDRATVLERRPPGWDTLDLYDVRPVERWHEVPLLQDDVERFTVSGWVWSEAQDGR
jgi:Rps23 Pro-64 3,4-dihydroxylase Tpa1-like proline 4-hydroxylase